MGLLLACTFAGCLTRHVLQQAGYAPPCHVPHTAQAAVDLWKLNRITKNDRSRSLKFGAGSDPLCVFRDARRTQHERFVIASRGIRARRLEFETKFATAFAMVCDIF